MFIIGINKNGQANDSLTSAKVETVSLILFNDKVWNELIPFCDKAIKNGFDYYYLRMRAGIACYETKKYRKAETHFRKALSYNSGDEDATNYLYLCLVYDEKYEEATWLSKSFNEGQASKLGTKKHFPFSFINLEGAIKLSSRMDSIGNAQYYQLGIEHYLFRRVSFFHSFSYNGQTDYSYYQNYGRGKDQQQPPWDTTTHLFDHRNNDVSMIRQFHYFLKANIPFKNNFLLSLSGQLIYDNDTHTIYDTVIHLKDNQGAQNPPAPNYSKQTPENTHASFVWSSTLKKYTTYIDYSIGTIIDFIPDYNEYQVSAALEYHPFANANFNVGGILYLHWHQPFSTTSALAFSPYVSFTPIKKLTFTTDFMQNSKGNVVEYSGYYVNNTPFYIKNRFSLGAKYKVLKKLSVYANYGLENRGSRFSDFTFTNNLFLLGISITR